MSAPRTIDLNLASCATVADGPLPETRITKPVGRTPEFDFVKGALVVIMVVYHWLNYFVGADGSEYKYLRFLTPSFIFITGFFISHIYLQRYGNRIVLSRRLFVRGLKLVTLFLILNFGRSVLSQQEHSLLIDWRLYVYGATTTSRAAFAILLPIGYLLILCAGLVLLSRAYAYSFHVASGIAVSVTLVAGQYGFRNAHLELLTIGMLGVCTGFIPIRKIEASTQRVTPLLIAYILYLFSVSVWNEVFPLQVIGVFLSLAILFLMGAYTKKLGVFGSTATLLGQYSLLAYIAQILILQMLRKGLHHFQPAILAALVALVAGLVLTILTIMVVDGSRRRILPINRLYSVIFN